jgi:uncharacterized protein YndB with AHSA1/START domain
LPSVKNRGNSFLLKCYDALKQQISLRFAYKLYKDKLYRKQGAHMAHLAYQIDPRFDLVFERNVELPPEVIWAAWTIPANLKPWFTPVPWQTIDCEIDLRPGGIFKTVMRSPEGEEFPNIGCYLEVIPNQRLTWTNALAPGYRPISTLPKVSEGNFFFTATIALEPHEQGTKYSAIAMHGNEEDREKHASMGFEEGWGKALEQLVDYMKQA